MKVANNEFKRSIFIDSSNIEEIKKWNSLGVIDGVTTNQYIFLKDGIKLSQVKKLICVICQEMKGKPVSVELTNSESSASDMVKEAISLYGLAANIVIKVPLIPDTTKSLWVTRKLIDKKIRVNITLMMTYEQLILASFVLRQSKKTSFISLFWGRTIEDQSYYRSRSDFMAKYPRVGISSVVNGTPNKIVESITGFLNCEEFKNIKLIVGSIRTASMVGEAFAAGSHIVTITPEVLQAMLFSKRTLETMDQFNEAWRTLIFKGKKS